MTRIQVSLIASFFSLGVALQSKIQIQEDTDSTPTCYSGDKLYFVHVMKDGGKSIDDWFNCLGENLNFSVQHINEGYESGWTGTTRCSSSVCSAHANSHEKTQICGRSFANAKTFSTLREPVSRIFSLYKYFKYHVKDGAGSVNHDFLTEKNEDGSGRNFEWLLKAIANKSLIIEGKSMYTDEMTMHYFSPNSQTLMMAHGRESIKMFKSDYVATGADLTAAKRELRKLNAIFFTEHMDKWQKHYHKSGLPFSEDVYSVNCQLEKDNVNDCSTYCHEKPSKKEVAMAREMNALDIELFAYAKTLPNAIL